jgi:methylenetetrahydrofolate dehydrogenase (NADP+)/methenyltetrahydrofolate cyclohydrolase
MISLVGKEIATLLSNKIAKEVDHFKTSTGVTPTLAVVLVGDDPASLTYVKSKGVAAVRLGFNHRTIHLPEATPEAELLALLEQLNSDGEVDGILVQLPLPTHIDELKVIQKIDPIKDVDGLHPLNMGLLLLGKPRLVPCTPLAILHLLDHYQIETRSKNVTIVGRSNIVGKPLAALLSQKGRDATVTLCHSQTKDLVEHIKRADILIAAIGVAQFIKGEMVKEGAVVIDVGINRLTDESYKRGYRLVGDVEWESVSKRSSAITPVPGGVGPLTIAMLMKNTLLAATLHHSRRNKLV